MLSWGSKNKYGAPVAIFQTIQKMNGHERNRYDVVRVMAPSVLYNQDGHQAAILSDIKNLFDNLGANFQTN